MQHEWYQNHQQTFLINESYADFNTKLQKCTQTQDYFEFIDVFDVSNLGQSYQVGVCTVFHNGQAKYKLFRKFLIPHTFTNDFDRTYFLIKKRYQSLLKENNFIRTSLLIMDGGLIQINAGSKALQELGIQLPIIGLVKNEQHQTEFLINQVKQPFDLGKNTLFYLWLAKMQTITHEFAIKYHHQRKQKGDLVDPLLTVPGISIRISKLLYSHFNNFQTIVDADFEAINKIIRNKKTTMRLINFLKEEIK